MADNKIRCKICCDDDNLEDFIVPLNSLGEFIRFGEVLLEAHFVEKHPEEYKRYLESRTKSNG